MTTQHRTTPSFDRGELSRRIRRVTERTNRDRRVPGVVLGVATDDGDLAVLDSAGEASPGDRYIIASVSKLFTTAIVRQLVDERRLRLDDRVVDVVPGLDLHGLHRHGGVDRTAELRVRHLLDQTSGLADYFDGGVQAELRAGGDRAYSITDVVGIARSNGAEFPPGDRMGRRAAYSDTNFLLLTAIIEAVTGRSFPTAVAERITGPLGLTDTTVFTGTDLDGVLAVHEGSRALSFPLALASEQGAGGIISTLHDQLRFSRAFHTGELFEPRDQGAFTWNRVFPFVDYGAGTMRYQLPRWMSGRRAFPELIGHSGVTGSFLFHSAELGLHLAGTVNQGDAPARPYRLLPRLVAAVRRAQSRP
ncbi:MAG: serine hydrolase domain-containing protein [Actinomycetota bacterium]